MYDLERHPSEPPPSDVDPLGRGRALPSDDIDFAYVRSKTSSYRRIFDEDAQHEHAAIAFRRGERATYAEIWKKLGEGIVAIAVVAEDRPGLLSRISAALVAHDMDVIAAQAYGRPRREGEQEAVDLIWIRRVDRDEGRGAPICSHEVSAIAETLDALVRGQASFEGAVSFAKALRGAVASTRVRFERDAQSGGTLLLVDAVDRPGLLLVVSRTLFENAVQIVGSHVMTQEGRVSDRFLVTELDGSPLSGARELGVQTAVLAALRDA